SSRQRWFPRRGWVRRGRRRSVCGSRCGSRGRAAGRVLRKHDGGVSPPPSPRRSPSPRRLRGAPRAAAFVRWVRASPFTVPAPPHAEPGATAARSSSGRGGQTRRRYRLRPGALGRLRAR
ncbi:unnamed protein product, partial [Scytosiphon promiscuus]